MTHGRVRIAVTIRPCSEPLLKELTTAETLAHKKTGAFPRAVILDARDVGISATVAECLIDRAIRLVGPCKPRLLEVIVISHERIIQRRVRRP